MQFPGWLARALGREHLSEEERLQRAVDAAGKDWRQGTQTIFAAAYVLLALFAFGQPNPPEVFAGAAILATGAALAGGAIGFLFGIPRAAGRSERDIKDGMPATIGRPAGWVRANTNLEEISDWLTKILVGVGLTQIGAVPDAFSALVAYTAPVFRPSAAAVPVAAMTIVAFAVTGFLMAFLYARTQLGIALAGADLTASALAQQHARGGAARALEVEQLARAAADVAAAHAEIAGDGGRPISPVVAVLIAQIEDELRATRETAAGGTGTPERKEKVGEDQLLSEEGRRIETRGNEPD